MAKILNFRNAERRDGGGTSAGAPAEVIVFPGVRYERWDEAHDAKAPAPASAPSSANVARPRDRRRDVLELAD